MATNHQLVIVGLSGCLFVVSDDILVTGSFTLEFYAHFLNDITPWGLPCADGLDKLVYTQCSKGATTQLIGTTSRLMFVDSEGVDLDDGRYVTSN